MTFAISSAVPVEQALNDFHRWEDEQPEITDKQIDQVASFIERRLLRASGRSSPELREPSALAHKLFADRIADAIVDFGDDEDDGITVISRLALIDHDEAGYQLHHISTGVIAEIARDRFDDFAPAARDYGWLE